MNEEEKLDFDENNYIDLLKEAVYYFNLIPRKAGNRYTKNTYELASKIDKFLEEEKYKWYKEWLEQKKNIENYQ